uniref:Uncharacterized protein n=1 Tax=Oryza barthii TaxID=65489 RepID=A0A0D3F3T4_9ORYZ
MAGLGTAWRRSVEDGGLGHGGGRRCGSSKDGVEEVDGGRRGLRDGVGLPDDGSNARTHTWKNF